MPHAPAVQAGSCFRHRCAPVTAPTPAPARQYESPSIPAHIEQLPCPPSPADLAAIVARDLARPWMLQQAAGVRSVSFSTQNSWNRLAPGPRAPASARSRRRSSSRMSAHGDAAGDAAPPQPQHPTPAVIHFATGNKKKLEEVCVREREALY